MKSWIWSGALITWIVSDLALAAIPPTKRLIHEEEFKGSWASALPEGERALYVRIIEAYQKGKVKELVRLKDVMLKRYPRSVYADNTLYLTGLLFFHRGEMAEALRYFGQVTERKGPSNKAPAALYARSVIYGRLNLPDLARQLLEDVMSRYPGSPEAQRAKLDLKKYEKRG